MEEITTAEGQDTSAAETRATSAGTDAGAGNNASGPPVAGEVANRPQLSFPTGLQDSLNAVQLFFPAGCYTLFQVSPTQHCAVTKTSTDALANIVRYLPRSLQRHR